jgi:hypothetical protein
MKQVNSHFAIFVEPSTLTILVVCYDSLDVWMCTTYMAPHTHSIPNAYILLVVLMYFHPHTTNKRQAYHMSANYLTILCIRFRQWDAKTVA